MTPIISLPVQPCLFILPTPDRQPLSYENAMNTTHRTVIGKPFIQRLAQRAQLLAAIGAVCTVLTACSGFPYKADIAQGNFVSKEQVSALKLGMPRAQVMDILGTPLLVSVFHADRWEYVFSLKRQGIDTPSYKLTVFFKGDALDKIDGSKMPTEQEFVDALSANKSSGIFSSKPPQLEMTEQELKATEKPAKSQGEPK